MVKRKAEEIFGEIDWDEIEDGKVTEDLVKTERKYAFYTVLFLLGAALLIPSVSLLVSEEELQQIYNDQQYTWLNQCKPDCQRQVNIELLDRMTDCDALSRLYEQPHDNFALQWGMAINDRATSLGCAGFPKELQKVAEEVQAVQREAEEKITAKYAEEQEQLRNELSKKQPRFTQSISDGSLGQYILDTYQDSKNSDLIIIIASPVWERMLEPKRQQLARAMWQKWVNINNPSQPSQSFIELRNGSGALIGGSNPQDASDIWVKKD